MNKEELCKCIDSGEKIFRYVYKIEHGKESLGKYECKINGIHNNGFETFGFGYIIPFFYFNEWRLSNWSSNAYTYYIFLTEKDIIEDYLQDIKKYIAKQIQEEIKSLEKSLSLVQTYT